MHKPIWQNTFSAHSYARLDRDLEVDVAIIGGGITAAVTAYLLQSAGVKVAVFERDSLGSGEISRTTAHVTAVTDERLSRLVSHFGETHAALTWQAGQEAIELLENIVVTENIECEWRRIPGYLLAAFDLSEKEEAQEHKQLEEEALLAQKFGFETKFWSEGIPFFRRSGFQISQQAKFHPLNFVDHLLQIFQIRGGLVFEHSSASEVSHSPLQVRVNEQTVSAEHIVVATHFPRLSLSPALKGLSSIRSFIPLRRMSSKRRSQTP